jgi:Tfp pilus assembly protein PilF
LASARSLVVEKLPLLLISLAFGGMTLWVHRDTGTMPYLIVGREIVGVTGANLANAVVSYVGYLGMALWPSGLSVFYPHPASTEGGGVPLEAWEVAVAGALLVLITFSAIKSRRRYAIVGWSWYLVSLLPAIGIFQTGGQSMADRYTYVPLIGIFIAVAWGGAELVARWRPRGRSLAPAAGAAASIALVLCAVTAQQTVQHWRDSISLYENALFVNPRNNVIRLNFGNTLVDRGDVEKGMAQFRTALEVNPNYVDAHHNLGRALVGRKRYSEAITHYTEALRIRPDHAIAHNSLGKVLRTQGRNEQASHHFLRAIELGLEWRQTHYDLANLLRQSGNLRAAIYHYQRTLEIDPDHGGAKRALQSLHGRVP